MCVITTYLGTTPSSRSNYFPMSGTLHKKHTSTPWLQLFQLYFDPLCEVLGQTRHLRFPKPFCGLYLLWTCRI